MFQGGQGSLSNGMDIQNSTVHQNQRGNTEGTHKQNSCFLISSEPWLFGFQSNFSPVTLATFIFMVNKDEKESCVYLQIIHETEHTLAPNFAAEILPWKQIRAAHMPQRMGEPNWYYCFRELTHQKKKKSQKGSFRKALARIPRFLTPISDPSYSKQPLSSKNDDSRTDTI